MMFTTIYTHWINSAGLGLQPLEPPRASRISSRGESQQGKACSSAYRVTDASEDLPKGLGVLCTLDGRRSWQFGGLS